MIKLDNIYHGDCLDLIQHIPDHSIDTVITDLPYGISYQSNRATHGRKNSPKFDVIANDEKPVDLLRRLILDSTPEMGTVLDCTCGSGTTLLAAIEEKRHYIGFEIDEKYYNIASRRIKDLLAYPKMF